MVIVKEITFLPKTGFPATRVHLTVLEILKNRLLVALLQTYKSDLDPRSPISISIISNDITLPPIINGANLQVALRILVIRALGLPRNLALEHLKR